MLYRFQLKLDTDLCCRKRALPALRVKDAENQLGSITWGRARCRAGLPLALKEEKLRLQMGWKRAEGCAREGRVGRRGQDVEESLAKPVKGEKAFHMKTCKKQLVCCCTLHSPIQSQAERCWLEAQTSTLQLSKSNSYGLIFFSISFGFPLVKNGWSHAGSCKQSCTPRVTCPFQGR